MDSALEAAWAASPLASAARLPQAYRAFGAAGGALSEQRTAASGLAVAALAWLGRHAPDAFAPLVRLPFAARADWPPAAAKAFAVPTDRHFAADAAAWPVAPVVVSFTAESVRDPAYTRAMFVASPPDGTRAEGAPVRAEWGKYGEDRTIYTTAHFGGPEPRTTHLGVDVGAPAGTPVHVPLDGVVHSVGRNAAAGDYGPTVVLRHEVEAVAAAAADGGGGAPARAVFYSLYGHLSLSTLVTPDGTPRLVPGQRCRRGEVLGWVGDEAVNGGWPPHVHVQLVTDMGEWEGDFSGVCARSDWPAYAVLCPDANLLLRCPFVAPVGWDASATGAGLAAVRVLVFSEQ